MAILSVDRIELGYCGECGTATVVARLQLRPWRHTAQVCADCLRGFAAVIAAASVAVLEGTHGQHDQPSA